MSWEPQEDLPNEYTDAPEWGDIILPAIKATEADPPDVWRNIGGDASWRIAKAVSFLEHAGVKVVLHDFELPEGIVGRTTYEPVLTVQLNESRAHEALLTVLHEAGHVLSYWHMRKHLPEIPDDIPLREQWAYRYGWVVIRLLGFDDVITKEMWREFNVEEGGPSEPTPA